jgi:hypothetical protein
MMSGLGNMLVFAVGGSQFNFAGHFERDCNTANSKFWILSH